MSQQIDKGLTIMDFFSRIRRMISGQERVVGAIDILAPVSGKIVDLEQVPDAVFADKIVGDGIAIQPEGRYLVAPISGKIGKMFDTHHAFSIESPQGVELFVHFGIGTIELRGNGFTGLVNSGDTVEAGQPIIEFDLDYLKQQQLCLLTPVVVANMEDFKGINKYSGRVKANKDVIFSINTQAK